MFYNIEFSFRFIGIFFHFSTILGLLTKSSFFQVCILELEEFGVTHPHLEGHHLLPEGEHQPRPGPGEVRVLAVPGPEYPRQSLKQELLPTGLQGSPHPPAQGAWLSLPLSTSTWTWCAKNCFLSKSSLILKGWKMNYLPSTLVFSWSPPGVQNPGSSLHAAECSLPLSSPPAVLQFCRAYTIACACISVARFGKGLKNHLTE